MQYMDGGQWKIVFDGKKIGRGILKPITPVTSQVFRLNIIRRGPDINMKEFTLFMEE